MPLRTRNPCSYLPRRLQIVTSLTAFVILCIFFFGSSPAEESYLNNVPYGPQLQSGAHSVVDHLPKLPNNIPLNPFGTPAHKPPAEQPNSKVGDASWFSDFSWRHPFSSSVTLDEERAVLPPVKERPPVYTYFDQTGQKDDQIKEAEKDLLQIWRRAWWAQGFKPVVLGRGEATNNQMYRRVHDMKLQPDVEFEAMRWLAWANMGTGILCNWLAVPMAHYDDKLLSFLRGGVYPDLTRYEDLKQGLYVGSKDDIEKALKVALDSSNLEHTESFTDAIPTGAFKVEPDHDGIAFYSDSVIRTNYGAISQRLESEQTRAGALIMLASLVNSHLHLTWQNWFSSGVDVLKPIAQNTSSMIEPAVDIATNLTQCAETPIPTSCPPNRPKCAPCVSSQPMSISTLPVFRNTSTLFTIATVPHPYTLQSLMHTKDDMDIKYIRRNTSRDCWIMAATKEVLGTGISSFARLPRLKGAVASDYGSARSLWLTAETPYLTSNEKDLEDLEWIFGFHIGPPVLKTGRSETPVPGPERRPPPPKFEFEGPAPSEEQLKTQKRLVDKSRYLVDQGRKGGQKAEAQIRDVMEAWNLADTEAWKFVRAFNARRTMERRKWEDEEAVFIGKRTLDRWKEYYQHG